MAAISASRVRRLLAQPTADALAELTLALAELGWQPTALPVADGPAAVSLAAGGQPQILVAPVRTDDTARSVSLGYSHEAILTLDWGPEALRIHRSSGWRTAPGDAPLLEVDSTDVVGVAQVLSAISRDRFHSLSSESATQEHPPLAELLARAFAEFRRQTVDSELLGTGPGELEGLRLFHQLLFMRFHEDRFGVPEELRIARVLETDDFPRQLGQQLQWYSSRFDSKLFASALNLSQVPQSALHEVIRQLVEPWQLLRLDFSVTTNEVAGRLYQSYLRLAPARIDEGRLFPGAEIRTKQKQHGAYYTPAAIATFLVQETLTAWLVDNRPDDFAGVRVIDPACGSGAFLVAAYDALLDYWSQRFGRPLTENERSEILSTSLFGVDDDAAAVMLCRVHLLEAASLANHTLPELTQNIVRGDSLTGSGLPEDFLVPGSYDIVVTNPPFAAPRLAVLKRDLPEVFKRFDSLRGTGRNFAYAFAELAFDLLGRGGRAGFLVPRALLDGPSSSAAREALGTSHLRAVLDFGRNIVFDFTLAYIAAVVVARQPAGHSNAGHAVAVRLSDDLRPKADVLDSLDKISLDTVDGHVAGVTAVIRPGVADLTDSDSWAPFTLRWRLQLRKEIGVPTMDLGSDHAPRIAIGTQTGADKRFVLEASSYHVAGRQIAAGGVSMPSRFVPVWVKGQDVHPFRVAATGSRVVVPMTGEHPAIDEFIQRQGGVPPSFRPGQLAELRKPKVLVRNLFLEPAAAADVDGDIMVPQGVVTAMVPATDSIDELLFAEALLNSSLYQWLLQGLAHPRAGGFGRLMAHHWSDVPWPQLPTGQRNRIVRAGAAVRSVLTAATDDGPMPASRIADAYWRARHELDKQVLDALQVSQRLRAVVSSELWRMA